MEPRLKWNKIILKNFILTWNHVWNEIKLFKNILVFYFYMEPCLKGNKIILRVKIILFHFRRGSVLK